MTASARGGGISYFCSHVALCRAGARAVRVTPRTPAAPRLDALVIGGGDDISAELYGGEVVPDIRVDPDRDRLELELLTDALERDLPVLGVCRGAQMLNVALGGTLVTDIYQVYERAPRLRTPLPAKRVTIAPGSFLARVLGRTSARVNALHHQAVDRLGAGLAVVARDEVGIVQAIELPHARFAVGVQWHPEYLPFAHGQWRLYRALVAAIGQPASGVPLTAR